MQSKKNKSGSVKKKKQSSGITMKFGLTGFTIESKTDSTTLRVRYYISMICYLILLFIVTTSFPVPEELNLPHIIKAITNAFK